MTAVFKLGTPAQFEYSQRERGMRRYRQLGRVGQGAYGTVYKAEHRETGEIVCRKHTFL